MPKSTLCPATHDLSRDIKFQQLKEHYKDRKNSDFVLLTKLQVYREQEDLDVDWYPETEADYKGFTDYLDSMPKSIRKSDVTKESINNLYKTLNSLYTPARLDNRIYRITRIFGDYVSSLVKKTGLTRQQVIARQATDKKNGLENILDKTFEYIKKLSTIEGQLEWYNRTYPTATEQTKQEDMDWLEHRAYEFNLMYENKESLGLLAAVRIGAKEGFKINIDTMEYSLSAKEDMDSMEDENEDSGQDTEEASKGDRYIDDRTLKLSETLSTEARALLDNIYLVDKKSKPVRDDLGYLVPVDQRQAIVSLHRILYSAASTNMMQKLEAATAKYPWVRSLVNHLKNNPDDEELVYCNFKKSNSLYYYGYKDKNGKIIISQINNVADGKGLSRYAGQNINSGITSSEEYSIVDEDGKLVSAEKLDKIKSEYDTASKPPEVLKSIIKVSFNQRDSKWAVTDPIAAWRQMMEKTNESDFNGLSKLLRGLGFDVSAADVKYALTYSDPYMLSETDRKGRTSYAGSFNKLVDALDHIYFKADWLLKNDDDLTGSHLYAWAQGDFKEVADILAALQSMETEERSISGKKALSSSTTPNAIHDLVDKLSNAEGLSDEQYKQMLMNDFGQFEGMSLGFGNELALTGWLADLYNDDVIYGTTRKSFKVVDFTDYRENKSKQYQNLTSADHNVVSFAMYSNGTKNRNFGLTGKFYQVPISADYETAYNFICAPSYTRDELVERLAQEVECEAQRIAAIQERKATDPTDPNATPVRPLGDKNNVYEKNGVHFNIFPELNTNGFIEEYQDAFTPTEAHNVVKRYVSQQLDNLVVSEKAKLKDQGMFRPKKMKLLGLSYKELEKPDSKTNQQLDDWILNEFYARQQFFKLMYGGTEFFKNLADSEKRNMYSHATRLPLYTNAKYKGEKVGKDNQHVIYISDDVVQSSVYEYISNIADKLRQQGKISAHQAETMKKAYKNITTTDGQGLRTLDSYREVKIMASQWTDADELAYQHVKSGNYAPEDAQHFITGIKPVYTGYETVPARAGKYQKPVRVPVLHKYSEMVLLPEVLEDSGIQNATTPFKAFNKINDALAKDRKIDLFLFGSGVKVGGHSVIDAFAKNNKTGERILKSSDDIADYVTGLLQTGDFWIHTLPYKYYGITASMHDDVVDDKIASATQAEKMVWGNIAPDETMTVAGRTMKSVDGRDLFYRIKEARTIDSYKRLLNRLSNKNEIANLLKSELASKTYQPRDLMFALQMRDNGTFVYPLYSPNIKKDVVSLLSSIVKKTFTKVPTAGANMTQVTSLGLDSEFTAQAFTDNDATRGFGTLGLKFDSKGNFQYSEAIMPLVDSNLQQFADENGNITPERLEQLVKDGYIEESTLYFIAYRTPSDAEHSVIPCKVKGFTSAAAGPVIRLPREVMVMTGHDYDGDKMRCHFKETYVGWNYNKIRMDYERLNKEEVLIQVLADSGDVTLTPYEAFRNMVTSETNEKSKEYKAVREVKYDWDKTPLENIKEGGNYTALNNALVDLMFAQLTSENGGLKMFIPGGSGDMQQYANEIGTRAKAVAASPYTVSHATEAHDYMMEGAGMIGVYAISNSSGMMFQRINLRYIPKVDKDGNPIEVSFFGNKVDSLYPMFTGEGKEKQLASLGKAHLLNASVDNGKDPLLGYLNQTAQLAHITNFLDASGLKESDIHLIMNQPVMRELGSRLKGQDESGLPRTAGAIITELAGVITQRNKAYTIPNQADSVTYIASISRERMRRNTDLTYADLLNRSDSEINDQIKLLQTIRHINSAARDLDQFAKLTRPESNSGGIDASLGGTISRVIQLDKFRERMSSDSSDPIQIAGVSDVLGYRKIYGHSMSEQEIEDALGTELREVVALNTLMKDSILDILKAYFPQARESWLRITRRIADQYSYEKMPADVIDRIGNDMVLWKLLNNRNFVTGNPKDEQERIVKDVPAKLKALKKRLDAAKKNPGKDEIADYLKDNVFINNLDLGVSVNSENQSIPRIRFKLNGATLEDAADTVRAAWGQMLNSQDEEIRQLATDLFKYNIYTNGLTFGRYEFAHFAPVSVVLSTPKFIKAMNDVLSSNWEETEEENFYNQYIMNHWGDKNLVYQTTYSGLPNALLQKIGLEGRENANSDEKFRELLGGKDFVLIKAQKEDDALYKVIRNNAGEIIDILKVQKLGIRNKGGQVIVQYNPREEYTDVHPVFTTNRVAWETRDVGGESETEIDADDEAARQAAIDDIPFEVPGLKIDVDGVHNFNTEVDKAAAENSGKLTAEQSAALGFGDEFGKTEASAYENELESIKARAIANGTFMMASTGKPTNLTERQWLQVRTVNFKSWFGVWDLANRFVKIISAPKDTGFSNLKEAETWAKANIAGEVTHDEVGTINISNRAIEKYTSEPAVNKSSDINAHLSALRVLPTIIENSIVGEIHEDKDGSINIKDIVRLFGCMTIDGKNYRVKTTVKRYTHKNEKTKAYSYEVTEIELLEGTGTPRASSADAAPTTNNSISATNLLKNVKTSDGIAYILDNYSKVVDENGEPLVVYHGNRTEEKIRAFNKTKQGSQHKKLIDGFWFVSDERIAREEYAVKPESTGSGVENLRYGETLGVFLNMRNPVVDKQKGLTRSASPYGEYDSAKETIPDFISRVKGFSNGEDGYILTVVDSDGRAEPFYSSTQTQFIVQEPNQIKSATGNNGDFSGKNDDIYFSLVSRDKDGNVITGVYPATPAVVDQARAQQALSDLNKSLRKMMKDKGVNERVIDEAEARIITGGVSEMNAATVLANGMAEVVRLSNGDTFEYALPEEFAHISLAMLGDYRVNRDDNGEIVSFTHENRLVERLLNALNRSESAMKEAFGDQYDLYKTQYDNNREKLIVEAAGKLVSKHMFLNQYIKTPSTRTLVQRVCDAIKAFFKTFSLRNIYDAIFGANKVASQLARDLLSGKIADEMSLEKITKSETYLSADKDLSGKKDILSKMLKNTLARLDILERRMKHRMSKGASSRSLDVTKLQIEKLTKQAQNQKLEITVMDYLKDCMMFMSEMEKSVDAVVNNKPANSVCKKLQIVKDTLYSFASVLEDVNTAVESGELEQDVNLDSAISSVSRQIEKFWTKYNRISNIYFEKFLSSVYGEDGVTITIGREKGRKISIHEMATTGGRDISFISRFFDAVSDADDFVLQAIDKVTKDAKLNAREEVRKLRPRLETALAAVIEEQGNRDTSWMFKRAEVNGHKVRTGTYITEKEAKSLSPARYEYWKTFMELKKLADECCPSQYTAPLKMIMFRKEHDERMREAQSVKGKLNEEWENAKRSVLEMGDIELDEETVLKDLEGNIVDQLPLKFLNKSKNETYDDMTEDTARALMAYLGMAFEYREMNNVVGILENARYASSKRDIQQKRGLKELVTKAGEEGKLRYKEPYTVKQAKTHIQDMMNDYYQMHIYGHINKDEGTFGKTRISKRKVTNALVGYTSLTQMALNIHQRIVNVNTGFTQIVVETAGKQIKAGDVAWASSIWMANSADRMAETGKTDYDNKLSLFIDKFDIHQDNGREVQSTKYSKSDASRTFNSSLLYAGLTIGEDFLSSTTALAYARNYKMVDSNGKQTNLWDAYEVAYTDPKNKRGAYLQLKKGYKKANGNELTFEDEKNFARKVIATNFELQGIYNVDDRSAIQQHSLGALAIMYRKWIAPALKRRYAGFIGGGVRYSNMKGEFTQGYYTTAKEYATNVVKDWFSPVSEEESQETVLQLLTDMNALKAAIQLNWNKMTDYEKGNCRKAVRELVIMLALIVTSGALKNLPPDDHDGNKFLSWADDIALTQLFRLRSEIGSQAPTPNMLNESLRILSSPFAAMRPLRDTLNIFQLLWVPNYFEEVKSGKYKGHSKAHKYFMNLPMVSLFRKFDNVVDPTPLLNYYSNMNH